MTKSKKPINIILICIVMLLWGTVIYRYFNNLSISDEYNTNQEQYNSNITFNTIEKDTFKLLKLDRDPFLNKMYSNYESVLKQPLIKRNNPKSVNKKEQTRFAAFPNIKYFGYIKSKNKNEELVLLKINNRLERVKLKSKVEGLIIEKIYGDSIEVLFNNEKRVFIKN